MVVFAFMIIGVAAIMGLVAIVAIVHNRNMDSRATSTEFELGIGGSGRAAV